MIAFVVLCLAQASPPSQLPESTQRALESSSTFGDALTRMLWMLGITVLVLLLLARFLPKWLGVRVRARNRGLIRVVESQVLEPRKSIYLVRVVDQFFLLGTSDQRIEVLAGGDLEPETLARLEAATRDSEAANDFLSRVDSRSAAPSQSTSAARDA